MDFNNRWINDNILDYILENGLENNIVTIFNTNFDNFIIKNRFEYKVLKVMNPNVYAELGIENAAQILKKGNIDTLIAIKDNEVLLRNWKKMLDNAPEESKDIIYSINTPLLLDEKNGDLTIEEIKKIEDVINDNNNIIGSIEKLIENHPEYIRLLEIPEILLDIKTGWYHHIRENIDDIDAIYEKFQIIRNTFGVNKFATLASSVDSYDSLNLYNMMIEAYQNGTIENWKKLLEVDTKFKPYYISFLSNGFFYNNTLEEIMSLNKLSCAKQIDLMPKSLYYVYSIKEIKNMDTWQLEEITSDRDMQVDNNKLLSIFENKKYKDNLKETVKEAIKGTYTDKDKLIDKILKFYEVVNFIPDTNVINKYPEDQIEKFNKKIWFNLARNKLYNVNTDTKCALVEAILSLGIFEQDEDQLERIGLLQKFATYLPKEEFTVYETKMKGDLLKDHFEIVGREVTDVEYRLNKEKLLNDPNILALFNTKEDAEEELDKLNVKLDEDAMEEELQKVYVNEQYKAVMQYIYKIGYDKVEHFNYTVKLKTDIQQLKIKNKKVGQELENKVREFYYANDARKTMTPNTLHRIFDGMDMRYKKGFYEFLRDNLDQIMNNIEKQRELSKIQRSWKKINEEYLGQKISFEKCENYLYGRNYKNVQEDEEVIAKLSSNCGYSQEDFEEIQKIFREQKQRTVSSIPQIEKKNNANGYTYKVLRLDDPVAIFIGELTDCCQALNDAGESCMRHSVTSQNGRVLVVQDENGKVVSQSWIWRNKNVLCFDNIEAIKKDSNNKKIISSDILDMVKKAARDFVEEDKKSLKAWKNSKIELLEQQKQNGEISKEQYDEEIAKINQIINGQQLNRVTVGIGNTDVDLNGLKKDKENKYPEEKVEYISDSRKQLILYEDKEIEHEENYLKTVAIYQDSADSKYLVDVDTSEIDDEIDDDEYDYDEYDDDEYDYDEYYDEDEYDEDEYDEDEYDEDYDESIKNSKISFKREVYFEENEAGTNIGLEDVKKTVNHVVGRNEARIALHNIQRILNNEKEQ